MANNPEHEKGVESALYDFIYSTLDDDKINEVLHRWFIRKGNYPDELFVRFPEYSYLLSADGTAHSPHEKITIKKVEKGYVAEPEGLEGNLHKKLRRVQILLLVGAFFTAISVVVNLLILILK